MDIDHIMLQECRPLIDIVQLEFRVANAKSGFRLWLKNYSDGKGLVIETDKFREGNHRPARIYKPNLEALAEHN